MQINVGNWIGLHYDFMKLLCVFFTTIFLLLSCRVHNRIVFHREMRAYAPNSSIANLKVGEKKTAKYCILREIYCVCVQFYRQK